MKSLFETTLCSIARMRPRDLLIIAVGGSANFVFVSLGLNGGLHLSKVVAFVAASTLITLQIALMQTQRRDGILLRSAMFLMYLGVAAFNIMLAAAGIAYLAGADVLGRRDYQRAMTPVVLTINTTDIRLNQMATAAEGLSAHSAEQLKVEAEEGGTCNNVIAGSGPDWRLRQADQALFAKIADDLTDVAKVARSAATAIRGEVMNYQAANHAAITQRINAQVAIARQASSDQRLRMARQELSLRLAQVKTGVPDSKNTAMLVMCPRDHQIAKAIEQVLDIKTPDFPLDVPLPAAPSEASSASGLWNETLAWFAGQPTDFSPWLAALIAAPFPDSFLLVGLALDRRRRRVNRRIDRDLADSLGLAGVPFTKVLAAAEHPKVIDLQSRHFAEGGIFKTHWVGVDLEDHAELLKAELMLNDKMAIDGGVRDGCDLPAKGTAFLPDHRYRMLALKPGIWAKLLASTMHTAFLEPVPPPATGAKQEDKAA